MEKGTLRRSFVATLSNGKELHVDSLRFCSMSNEDLAAISYSVKPLNFSGEVTFSVYLDGAVNNHDANYDDFFWLPHSAKAASQKALLVSRTKKTDFVVATAMEFTFESESGHLPVRSVLTELDLCVKDTFVHFVNQGEVYTVKKYLGIASTIKYPESDLGAVSTKVAAEGCRLGFTAILENHQNAWADIWKTADIEIAGDDAAQQGIRFNIFHLYQTYTGTNAKLNIGPKGFTGEKYGGATYWDTEAYCLPFYLKTADPKIARQLLLYRYFHLDKAIENAEKLGFTNGAALYPMVTMNGEECHNEWEITFEEIHRNGAIAFAIYNYVRHTGDHAYLKEFGFPVLLGIARFWKQRFNWSDSKQAYVMLGVTGPNEYENNVNNNWYTNYLARWCISYCIEVNSKIGPDHPLSINSTELFDFQSIVDQTYLPTLEGTSVFLQQDGFLDKELLKASDIPENQRPINQHWSWDRILRSVFIKQADVLQGLYLFEDHFTQAQLVENFDFYEPKTVHESSLSPCVHVILAAKIGRLDKAYELYLRTSRLDLDDYNHEADEGLHITSMAGTWMSLVEGMAGVRISETELKINPVIPNAWKHYRFRILYQNKPLSVTVKPNGISLTNLSDLDISLLLKDIHYKLKAHETIVI